MLLLPPKSDPAGPPFVAVEPSSPHGRSLHLLLSNWLAACSNPDAMVVAAPGPPSSPAHFFNCGPLELSLDLASCPDSIPWAALNLSFFTMNQPPDSPPCMHSPLILRRFHSCPVAVPRFAHASAPAAPPSGLSNSSLSWLSTIACWLTDFLSLSRFDALLKMTSYFRHPIVVCVECFYLSLYFTPIRGGPEAVTSSRWACVSTKIHRPIFAYGIQLLVSGRVYCR